ncbi:phage minor capsid protein [Salipaludibacillus sp. HK11]|uniref:phage minor capsid protein n=1 Tax=Salipaludibacillus sp. HK11 TaxID=3394320 RepID=UPI0039FB8A45
MIDFTDEEIETLSITDIKDIEELDKETQKLIMKYVIGYGLIVGLLQKQINRRLTKRQLNKLSNDIDKVVLGLNTDTLKYLKKTYPLYYLLSLQNIDKSSSFLLGVDVIEGASSAIHKRALKRATNDLYRDLAKNTRFMGREAKKIIRSNAQELLVSMIESGESYITVKKKLTDQLKKNGVNSFVDKGRKNWKIDKYADMVVRTKSRILHNEGTINRLKDYREKYPDEENFDLIQISDHNAEDWCSFYEGKVFSITGNSKTYPSIDTLPNQNFKTLHPNCKHVWLSYMPSVRGQGEVVSEEYQSISVKELNKIEYESRKKSRN